MRDVRYLVCSDGNVRLKPPPGWIATTFTAATVQQLKHDLVGEAFVPPGLCLSFIPTAYHATAVGRA